MGYLFSRKKIVYGRDQDPHTPSDLSAFALANRKLQWSLLSTLGPRFILRKVFPQTIGYLDADKHPAVKNFVAFTVDDSFCGHKDPSRAMTKQVQELFQRFNARCTFFTAGDCLNESDYPSVTDLIADGHELANHMNEDRRYDLDSSEAFKADFLETETLINRFNSHPNNWFRPPHAKLNKSMMDVLIGHGKTVIMTDCFANDTAIPDPVFISDYILKNVKPGSILLIHMPERGFREWNYEAMERTLEGLEKQGYEVGTVSELFERAGSRTVRT
mmetsp:Transcript_502/g.751  ORF Transcript_502/g.751 Transcript_502/m.751 type:complete len:274 (-) Transcript_502:638-1459(-)